MKTFETEKHSIPEGATHYRDETNFDSFAWYCDGPTPKLIVDGEVRFGYQLAVSGENLNSLKPIPQASIETPEEKEVLDSINSNLIKPREPSKPLITKVEWGGAGLPPVGVECWFNFKSRTPEKCTVKYIGDKICVYDDESGKEYSILLSSVEFSKLETRAERAERERANAIYDMCASADNFTEESNFWAGKFYDLGYRKEGE